MLVVFRGRAPSAEGSLPSRSGNAQHIQAWVSVSASSSPASGSWVPMSPRSTASKISLACSMSPAHTNWEITERTAGMASLCCHTARVSSGR